MTDISVDEITCKIYFAKKKGVKRGQFTLMQSGFYFSTTKDLCICNANLS